MRVFSRVLVVMMTVGVLGAGAAIAQHGDAEWLEAANQQFMDYFAAGDADALGMRYTVDAIFMPPNANPIEGREAITANFKETTAAGGTLRLTTDEVEIFGDVAHEVGRYVQEAASNKVQRCLHKPASLVRQRMMLRMLKASQDLTEQLRSS